MVSSKMTFSLNQVDFT